MEKIYEDTEKVIKDINGMEKKGSMISRELGTFYIRDKEYGSRRDSASQRRSFVGGNRKCSRSPSTYRRDFSRERRRDGQDSIDKPWRRSQTPTPTPWKREGEDTFICRYGSCYQKVGPAGRFQSPHRKRNFQQLTDDQNNNTKHEDKDSKVVLTCNISFDVTNEDGIGVID